MAERRSFNIPSGSTPRPWEPACFSSVSILQPTTCYCNLPRPSSGPATIGAWQLLTICHTSFTVVTFVSKVLEDHEGIASMFWVGSSFFKCFVSLSFLSFSTVDTGMTAFCSVAKEWNLILSFHSTSAEQQQTHYTFTFLINILLRDINWGKIPSVWKMRSIKVDIKKAIKWKKV